MRASVFVYSLVIRGWLPADVAHHNRMVSLVERMLDLHKRLAAEQMPHVKTVCNDRSTRPTSTPKADALVVELRPKEGADGGGGSCGGGAVGLGQLTHCFPGATIRVEQTLFKRTLLMSEVKV